MENHLANFFLLNSEVWQKKVSSHVPMVTPLTRYTGHAEYETTADDHYLKKKKT